MQTAHSRLSSRILLAVTLMTGFTLSSWSATFTWNKIATGSYNWDTVANWSPSGFPNAIEDVANITGGRRWNWDTMTIALNQPTITVGILKIGDTDGNESQTFKVVTNAPNQKLVFDNGASAAELNQTATSNGDLISAPVQIISALTVSPASSSKPLTISGPINGSGITLTKTDRGELKLTAANTFEGTLSVQAGSLVGWSQASGSPFGNSTNAIILGGSNPLLASYVPTLTLVNPTTASTTTFGDLTVGGTFNSGYLVPGAAVGGTSYLQGENLFRNAGATLVVSPSTDTSLADSEQIKFSSTGTSLTSGILPPWLVVARNSGDFATYGVNGIERATYTDTVFDPLKTDQVVNLTGATTLADPQTAYAVRVGANLNLSGNTLTLSDSTTGGLILLNNTTLSDSVGGGSLAFGSGELLAYVDAANSATISAPLSGTGIFRKFGTGTLILPHPSLPNNVNLQTGSLTLNPTSSFTYTGNLYGAGTLNKDGMNSISLSDSSCVLGGVGLKSGALALSNTSVTNLTSLSMPPSLGTIPGTTLSITNGSQWAQINGGAMIGNANQGGNMSANNHRVTVAGMNAGSGKKSIWDLGGFSLYVGHVQDDKSQANNNQLTVGAGGIVTNVSILSLARNQGGTSNRVEITDGGQVYSAGSAVIGHNGISNTLLVSGQGSLWDNGGGSLQVGTSSGSSSCSYNELLVMGSDAIVTNMGSVSIGVRTGGGTTTRTNVVVVSNGARMYSSTELNVGVGNAGASIGNIARVTGAGSTWDLGGALVRIGYGSQGYAEGNRMSIDTDGVITNAGVFYIGYANAAAANLNTLEIFNGGRLYSTGNVIVGRANSGTSQPRAANSNGIRVGGNNSRWDLGGASLTFGNATAGVNYPSCTATSNWLRVESGGSVTSVGALTIGNGALALNNRIELAGGSITAASLTVNTDNSIAPIIDAQGLTAMTVTGTATFNTGSWVEPSASKDAPGGNFVVLTANSIVNGSNLALSPATDTAIWSLKVTATQVLLSKFDRATLIIVR